MFDDKTIQSAVARLVAAATSASQVILFGSYAQGSADAGSDQNLLVIEQEISNKAEGYLRLRDAVGRLASDGRELMPRPHRRHCGNCHRSFRLPH
jgi:predicted nucleotidyltransferase